MSTKPRLIIMGHGGHGKGSVCAILASLYGFTSMSSSLAAFDQAIWPALKQYYIEHSNEQANKDACYADRHSCRALWGELIAMFLRKDRTRIAVDIFETRGLDVYDGIRRADELNPILDADLVDHVVWVGAEERLAIEPSSSMTVDRSIADLYIDNNGPAHDLPFHVRNMYDGLQFEKTSHRT